MHGIFYAWGAGVRKRQHLPAFENVHIYPFLAKLLELEVRTPIDGRAEVLAPATD